MRHPHILKIKAAALPARTLLPRLRIVCLMAFGLFLAMGMADASRADEGQKRVLTVSGSGETSAPPSIAFINTGVVSEAKTASAALAANTKTMNAIFNGLEEMKIARADIATSEFSVNPVYDNPPAAPDGTRKAPTIRGYQVTNQVTVTIRDLDRMGASLDKLVQLGSNRIDSIHFSVDKPEPLQDKARKLAVQDALRKARLYAAAAGVTLGPIISISESGDYSPRPVYMAKAMLAESAPVPIAGGTQTLTSNVSMTIEIQ